jgi:hypothetical protein
VNADRRGRIQARFAPLLDREIERGDSALRGDRRRDKVIVAGIEEDHGRTQFTAWRLVEVDPNEDDFTEPEGH